MIPILSPAGKRLGLLGWGWGKVQAPLEASACWSNEVCRTVAHDLITAYTKMLLFALLILFWKMHAQERLRAIIPHRSPSVLPRNRTPTGKKNTMPLLGLQYALFYIALIETSNLELILGGAPRRCSWYACKSMCYRTHCTAYFLCNLREKVA